MSFPIENGGSFHSYVAVSHRVQAARAAGVKSGESGASGANETSLDEGCFSALGVATRSTHV